MRPRRAATISSSVSVLTPRQILRLSTPSCFSGSWRPRTRLSRSSAPSSLSVSGQTRPPPFPPWSRSCFSEPLQPMRPLSYPCSHSLPWDASPEVRLPAACAGAGSSLIRGQIEGIRGRGEWPAGAMRLFGCQSVAVSWPPIRRSSPEKEKSLRLLPPAYGADVDRYGVGRHKAAPTP